jgi:hypothetical protein
VVVNTSVPNEAASFTGRSGHEPDDEIMEVLEAFLAREDVSQSAKQKILCGNIEALYTLKSA